MIISMENSARKVPYKTINAMGFMKYMLSQKADFNLVFDEGIEKAEEVDPDNLCGNIARLFVKAPLQEALNYPIVKLLIADAERHNEIYLLRPVGNSNSECVLDISQINRQIKVDRVAGVVSYHKYVGYKGNGKKR